MTKLWLALVLAGAIAPALAHDGANDSWFESLEVPGSPGSRCCGGEDCLPTEDETRDNLWWARTPDGIWHRVPPERVITDRGNPVGPPILCSIPNPDGGYTILCFVPGALT